jgi:type VI protein secretion system component VasF
MDSWHSEPSQRDARQRNDRRGGSVLTWGFAAVALVLAMVAFMYFMAPN